jgi:hypothetical protein
MLSTGDEPDFDSYKPLYSDRNCTLLGAEAYHSPAAAPLTASFLHAICIAGLSYSERPGPGQAIEHAFLEIRKIVAAIALPDVVVVARHLVSRIDDAVTEHHLFANREVIMLDVT